MTHRKNRYLGLAAGYLVTAGLALMVPASEAGAAQSPTPPLRFLDDARAAAEHAGLPCTARHPIMADGVVSASTLTQQILGAAAGTTGGIGKRLFTVTRLDDAKSSRASQNSVGTLRWAVDAARSEGGGWIVFELGLKGSIHLEAGLHLPSNTTLDGGCGGIELVAPSRVTQLTLTDSENVIVSGMSFTKDAYDDKYDKNGDAIALTDHFDKVAILHNAFHRCGDGCVDIVRKNRFNSISRATVAFNHFGQHNKVMLIGTLTCYKDKQAEGCQDPINHLGDVMAPLVFVTVLGNVFDGTSQRHPKVVSNAMVQLVNNLFSLTPTAYSNGVDSAVYGSATGSGGVLVAQGNIFVNAERTARIGAGPISAVRASTGSELEADGVVAALDNVTVGNISVVEKLPKIAWSIPMASTPVMPISVEKAKAMATCLLLMAGPKGVSATWPDACARP